MSVDVSIVIVSYNTKDFTKACLDSIYRETNGITFEVIVIDNVSTDGSADMIESSFPNVRLIRNGSNVGFGAGNNRAVEEAHGKYLLLLNPDTILKDNAIKSMIEFAEAQPEAGAWGGVCELPNGQVDPGSRQIMPSLWVLFCNFFVQYRRIVGRMDRSRDFQGDAPVLYGAFMMVRSDVWRQLGGFDESYKLYAEESDLCHRIVKAGYRIMMTGKARVIHYGGTGQLDDARRELNKVRGFMQFFRKHYSVGGASLGAILIWLYNVERIFLACLSIPFTGARRFRTVCRRLSIVVLHPSRWWYGWRGQKL